MKELVGCPYCRGPLVPHWNAPRFDRCNGCGLVLRNPFPSEADLSALYERAWDRPDENTGETGEFDAALAQQYARAILKVVPSAVGEHPCVLDFGAGKGALMRALGAVGCDVSGVEPYGFERLHANGLKVYKSLSDLPGGTRFDGIVSFDVVEHLREPWKAIAQFSDHLKPGGWLLVGTPNPSGLNAVLHKSGWREASKLGHILFMNSSTLSQILSGAGFKSIKRTSLDIRFKGDFVWDRVVHPVLRLLNLDGGTVVLAMY